METFLLIVFMILTVIFFVKWQKASERKQEPSPAQDAAARRAEDLSAALLRIERKVDGLAARSGPAPSAIITPGVAGPSVEPPLRTETLLGAEPARTAESLRAPGTPPQAWTQPSPLDTLVPEPFSQVAQFAPVAPVASVAPPAASTAPAPVSASPPSPLSGKPDGAFEAMRPIPPPEMPAWEREARVILARIWSWILVGEEFRPKGVPLEFAMAGTWLMRVGVVVLVSCVVWFLKWSMVHGILGPSGRVGLSFAAGAALTAAGYRLMGKRYQVLGQGMMGGGLAALYFAGYAAGPLYHLLPQMACFAMMALITLAGCVLASGTRSQVTAILAMMGGYATPALLSTGTANFPGLFSYMFLLGGGILGLALLRNWRLLHYLAFVAHWGLVFGSLRSYDHAQHFSTVLPFLILFFIQQHGVSIGHAFRRAQPISMLEAVQQFLHAGLFAALAYTLIREAAGRPWPALLAIGLGAVFVGQTLAVLKRMPGDRLSLSVSLGLAGFFAAWSVPLIFDGSSLTVAWSLMALAWLWTGLRIGSQLLIVGSQILFLLAGLHLGTVDFPQGFLSHAPEGSFGEYLRGFSGRLLTFGVFIASLFAASWLYRRRSDTSPAANMGGLRVSPEADLPFSTPLKTAATAAFLLGFAFLFVIAHFEASRLLGFHRPLRAPGIILIWTGFAAYLAFKTRRFASDGIGYMVAMAIALVCVRMLAVDWRAMGLDAGDFRFDGVGAQIAYRSIAHAALFAVILALGLGRLGPLVAPELGRIYRVAAVVLAFLVATLETRTVTGMFLPAFQAGAVSVVWALFAMGLVALGLRFNDRASRFGGLILFALVAGKVFLLDLASLDMIWRVLSFLSVGAVLLLGSFAYLRASKPDPEPESPAGPGMAPPPAASKAKEPV